MEKCVLTYVCFDSSDDSSCDYINAVKSKKDKCSHENNADSRSDTIKKVKKKKTNRIRENRKKNRNGKDKHHSRYHCLKSMTKK